MWIVYARLDSTWRADCAASRDRRFGPACAVQRPIFVPACASSIPMRRWPASARRRHEHGQLPRRRDPSPGHRKTYAFVGFAPRSYVREGSEVTPPYIRHRKTTMTISTTDYAVDDDVLRQAFGELRRRQAKLTSTVRPRRLQHPVERALAWIEAGVYGRCSVCTVPLSAEKILADPADMTCERCKCSIEASKRLRTPPYHSKRDPRTLPKACV